MQVIYFPMYTTGPFVRKVDNAFLQIKLYPVDNAIAFPNTYQCVVQKFIGWMAQPSSVHVPYVLLSQNQTKSFQPFTRCSNIPGKPGHLEEVIIQIQRFLKTKDSQVFFANRPITVMNLKFAKKLENKSFVFKKCGDWIIFSHGPGLSGLTEKTCISKILVFWKFVIIRGDCLSELIERCGSLRII